MASCLAVCLPVSPGAIASMFELNYIAVFQKGHFFPFKFKSNSSQVETYNLKANWCSVGVMRK